MRSCLSCQLIYNCHFDNVLPGKLAENWRGSGRSAIAAVLLLSRLAKKSRQDSNVLRITQRSLADVSPALTMGRLRFSAVCLASELMDLYTAAAPYTFANGSCFSSHRRSFTSTGIPNPVNFRWLSYRIQIAKREESSGGVFHQSRNAQHIPPFIDFAAGHFCEAHASRHELP